MNKNILPEIEVNRPSKFKDERGEIWTTYEKYAFKNGPISPLRTLSMFPVSWEVLTSFTSLYGCIT